MDKELKLSLGKIAHDLHMQYSGELSVVVDEVTSNQFHDQDYEGLTIIGNTLTFSSLDDRHKLTAFYLYEVNKESVSIPSEWFDIAHETWIKEIRNIGECKAKAAGYLLVLVHEYHDIFSLAVAKLQENTGAREVFDVLYTLSTVLPLVQTFSIDSLIELVAIQHESTKNDLAAGGFFSEIMQILERNPDACEEIHLKLGVTFSIEVAAIYTTSIIALAKNRPSEAYNHLINDINNPELILKNQVLWVLGRLLENKLLPNENAIKNVESEIISASKSNNEDYRRAAIETMARLIGSNQALDLCLIDISSSKDQYALQEIARNLAYRDLNLHEDFIKNYIKILTNINTGNQAGISHFDYLLSKLVRGENYFTLAKSCFEIWVCEQVSENYLDAKKDLEFFDNFLLEVSKDNNITAMLITTWLLSEEEKLNIAASVLLSYLWINRIQTIKFDVAQLDNLSSSELLFLIRHMLGYVYQGDQLVALSLSILDAKNSSGHLLEILHSLFVDEVGRDYPYLLVPELEKRRDSAITNEYIAFYERIILKIKFPIDQLNNLLLTNEIRSSSSVKRQFALARAKIMEETKEKANEKSVFLNLVTRIPIKAGKGWFSFDQGNYSEPSYMQSHSISFAMAIRDVNDVVGSEIRRFHFRHAKKDDV